MKSEQQEQVKQLHDAAEIYQDFPKAGITFLNIMPIVGNPKLLDMATNLFVDLLKGI